MKTKKNNVVMVEPTVDGDSLFARVATIIESRTQRAGAFANREVTMMYWEIGQYINTVVLDGGRAGYGKQIFSTLSRKLVIKYGQPFALRNMRRMMQFAEYFADFEIVSPLATQLSWSHYVAELQKGLETQESRRDSTLLTVGFNLRYGCQMNKSRTGRHFVNGNNIKVSSHAGLKREGIAFRRLKPTVNKVSPHAGLARFTITGCGQERTTE